MAFLLGMSGAVKGQTFQLDKAETGIGRNKDNAIIIDHAAVSSNHCVIIRDGDHYTLRDLKSTNGTRLNERGVVESPLKPKDLIRVGAAEFIFDGEGIATTETERVLQTSVEVAPGPTMAPASFNNISPFGARELVKKGPWPLVFAILGVLAIAGVVFVVIRLMGL